MRILVYGINYYPELTGIGKYTAEMCEWMAAKGHEVNVITAMPYYPSWEVAKDYEGRWWHTEVIKKVKISRVPLYVPKKISGSTRILHEFSFALSALFFWIPIFFKKKYDIVICICPPFHLGFYGIVYKWLRHSTLIYHIQDLQVDAARKLGIIKSEGLLRLLEKSEKFIFKNATYISSISEGMRENINKKVRLEGKYLNLPNWVDTNHIRPLPVALSLKSELGFKDQDKLILYSGNLGEKQGLDMIIHIAENLKYLKNVFFVFVGEGAVKEKLFQDVKDKHLTNVLFFPLQPYHKLSELLAIADIHLVLQKKAAADLLLPSKLLTILAAGGLSIVTAETGTSLYEMVYLNQVGILAVPEDEGDLQDRILENINFPNDMIKLNARAYAQKHLNIEGILANFERQLQLINHG